MPNEIVVTRYEIRDIDALWYEDGWVWNASYRIGEFTANAADHGTAFIAALKKRGITFKRDFINVVNDGDIIEVQSNITDEPLYAAIPMQEE